jgi:hypothetical protein
MITSAKEFIELRELNDDRATHDSADVKVWFDVIDNYPDYKIWVIHNKAVPIEILEYLALDSDSKIRSAVARKRKINDKIFDLLNADNDESVRFDLISNTKLSIDKLNQIKTDDSEWLKQKLKDKLLRHDG